MKIRLLELLACPSCRGSLDLQTTVASSEDTVDEGQIRCNQCGKVYPIQAGIPRFVPRENYASSFGFQWNRFRGEQIDSVNGSTQSRDRLLEETRWPAEWFKGKWILDAGCGAGRFLDVASSLGAEVVGMDISDAIDASRANLAGRDNAHFVQASIFDLPFRDEVFDACYCIGVLQHTPAPQQALASLPRVVREGGRFATTIYERRRFTTLNGKYLIRPLTRTVENTRLLRIVRLVMPILFPITEVLFRLPVLGRIFQFVIPVANYVEKKDLTLAQRYEWAVLDTFDMWSPAYDQPQREDDTRSTLERNGIRSIERTGSPGLNLVGKKGSV